MYVFDSEDNTIFVFIKSTWLSDPDYQTCKKLKTILFDSNIAIREASGRLNDARCFPIFMLIGWMNISNKTGDGKLIYKLSTTGFLKYIILTHIRTPRNVTTYRWSNGDSWPLQCAQCSMRGEYLSSYHNTGH